MELIYQDKTVIDGMAVYGKTVELTALFKSFLKYINEGKIIVLTRTPALDQLADMFKMTGLLNFKTLFIIITRH